MSKVQQDQSDYTSFLVEYGFTDKELRTISENLEDYASFEQLGLRYSVAVAPSAISGMGLFLLTSKLHKGYRIPARLGAIRTPAGRYVNHSATPNCEFASREDGGLDLVLMGELAPGTELTLDYRQALAANLAEQAQYQVSVEVAIHNRFQQFLARMTGSAVFPSTTREEIRHKICQIELAAEHAIAGEAFVNLADSYPLRHRYAKGMMAREISIPAGHFVIGRIHKDTHYNVITKGKVSVLTEEGGLEVFTAPCSMISPAGCKRVLMTHEDTVWETLHVTSASNPEELEADVIAPSYTALGWYDPKVELNNSGELQLCNSAEKLIKELPCHSQS